MSEKSKASLGVAVVTGASAGLGKVYAERLADRGYDLILVARRKERLVELAKSLKEKYGVNASEIVADLSKKEDILKVAQVIDNNSSITLLVNNAGVGSFSPLVDADKNDVDAMNEINVTALVDLSYAALKRFKQRNNGTIINIGSVLSFFNLPISTIYSATKGYVMNFTRGLQGEVEGTNVFVQLVLPASTATEIWDLAGIPLKSLNQDTVMTAENCVDSALAGLDMRELVTLPSVEDKGLWEAYDEARKRLFAATQIGMPASRYNV